MDEERVLAADWLARLRADASRSQWERLAEGQLMLLWKRRTPRQVRLMQEEEDKVRGDLLVNIQKEDEESQELA